jgi:ubiquinone/menaquinone biosynthesis C-methylase UbiE
MTRISPTAEQIRSYWNSKPLSASDVPYEPGAREYFEFYDKLRETIESVEFSHRLHEYRNFKGKRVLDVGSGNGYVLSRYAAEGASVDGVDITPKAIELCQRRFAHAGLSGSFQVARAEELPFADATFDCVCSMGVLHHVSDTELAVAEIHRVLKPGGRLIVMFYHRNSAQYQFKYRLVHLLKGRSMQELVNHFDGPGNPRGDIYSRRELRELLAAFEPPEMFVGFLEREMLTRRVGQFVPQWLLRLLEPRIGWNLYAKTRKKGAER